MPTVVVTRDLDATAPYAAALRALGFDTVAMPVTRTHEPDDRDALRLALERTGYAAVVCASARAASALVAARGPRSLPDVWAVGPATARALEAAGVTPLVPALARDGAALARALLARGELTGKRVLVPRAEEGRDDGIEILRAGGVEVDAVIAYRTVAAAADDPAIAQGRAVLLGAECVACAMFAPSQVAALDALVGIARIAAPFAAIGETTASALREAGAATIVVAATPTPEGIAKAVAAVYPRTR